MADKTNGQAGAPAPKKGINKMEAVRQALAHFGSDATPSAMRPWIKQQFGIDMSADHISTYKGDIKRKLAARDQAATTAAASPSPAVAAARAAKPAATKKPVAKKSAGPRPRPQKATVPQGASGGVSLEDLQAV